MHAWHRWRGGLASGERVLQIVPFSLDAGNGAVQCPQRCCPHCSSHWTQVTELSSALSEAGVKRLVVPVDADEKHEEGLWKK